MRVTKSLVAVWAGAGLALVAPRAAAADDRNRETVLTFSHDVAIPGRVLPAGTYLFRLANGQLNRHLVLIFDRRGRFVAMTSTIAATRFNTTDDTQITFEERLDGTPFLLKQWFYPGQLSGEEFIYPSRAK